MAVPKGLASVVAVPKGLTSTVAVPMGLTSTVAVPMGWPGASVVDATKGILRARRQRQQVLQGRTSS